MGYRVYNNRAITTFLASFATLLVAAQPSMVKKAAENIFTLTTFKDDGTLLASSHGVFTTINGECISDLKPFLGAKKAVVIDSKGKKHEVTRILGANEIYDVARFKINATSTKPASFSATESSPGSSLWLVTNDGNAANSTQMKLESVEKFMGKYSYYILDATAPDNTSACPIVNEKGQVVGLLQHSSTSSKVYATDANFIKSLTTTALSVNTTPYNKIGIPTALPTDKNQAMLALMISQQTGDSLKYVTAIQDFQQAFPTLTDGYVAEAQNAVDNGRYDEARKCMETMITRAEAKDDAHYNYAKLIYAKLQYKDKSGYPSWTYDKALNENETAYSIKPLPLYKDQEAQIRYAKGEYQKAYNIFMQLSETNFKNPDLYYNAALCKQQLNAPETETLALLDSAVNNVDSLNIRDAAKYFLMRGDIYNRMKNYRQAVFDYTRFEILSGRNVNANFYYIREQAEVNAKLFKQALVDIDNAIYLAPKEPVFLAEKASLQLRLNMFVEALETGTKCIQLAPDFTDAYLVVGLAQIKTGKKQEGVVNLKKAEQMGNSQATALIEKYTK